MFLVLPYCWVPLPKIPRHLFEIDCHVVRKEYLGLAEGYVSTVESLKSLTTEMVVHLCNPLADDNFAAFEAGLLVL